MISENTGGLYVQIVLLERFLYLNCMSSAPTEEYNLALARALANCTIVLTAHTKSCTVLQTGKVTKKCILNFHF